jgi:hypothetical protein
MFRVIFDQSDLRHFLRQERCFQKKILHMMLADIDGCVAAPEEAAPKSKVGLDISVSVELDAAGRLRGTGK